MSHQSLFVPRLRVALFSVSSTLAAVAAQNGTTSIASNDFGGGPSNGDSYDAVASGDGRYVAFQSFASDIVPSDTNGTADIFRRDMQTGEVLRVSVGAGGAEANGFSYNPHISADGRWIAFESVATNLVPGDTNGERDVFLHDVALAVTARVSLTNSGGQGNGSCRCDGLSADGSQVLFFSHASNLVPGAYNGWPQLYVRDLTTGTTQHVSRSTAGVSASPGTFSSLDGTISGDGRWVAFNSFASNLVPGDSNGTHDVFLHDRLTGTTTRESVATGGGQAALGGAIASIDFDGDVLVFGSSSSDLVPGDTNGVSDVFVRDRAAGTTSRISVDSLGVEGDADSWASRGAALSADGRFVVFTSEAGNLVPGDINFTSDAFVHDRLAATTERVSVSSTGIQGDSFTNSPRLSRDGRFVVFESSSTNLVAGDTNGLEDIFVHDRHVLQIDGCAANPADLRMTSAAARVGAVTTFGLETANSPNGSALLYAGAPGINGFGCGVVVPGIGEVLLAATPPQQLLVSAATVGGMASFAIGLPLDPALIGLQSWMQAFNVQTVPVAQVEASNALRVTVSL